jgi:malate permease and related proteins
VIAQYFFLLQIVAPVFLLMGIGYLLRKKSILTAEADRSLIRVVVTLLLPCLALHTIIGNEALRMPANLFLPPLFGFATCLLGITGARLGVLLLKPGSEAAKRAFVYTTSIQNYSYLTLPLCGALFDRNTTGVLFAFILGVELAFWSVVLWQLTGRADRGSWRRTLNPPMLSIVAAMILNSLDAHHWMPAPITTSLHLLGQCAVPMALLLSGALIADHMNLRSLKEGGCTIAVATLIRIGLVPLIIMAAARFLPLDPSLKAVLIIQAAMPAGIFSIVVTKVHHGDVPTALQVVLGTSLIGLITIPLWLGLGLSWIPIPH